jgi:fructokinase
VGGRRARVRGCSAGVAARGSRPAPAFVVVTRGPEGAVAITPSGTVEVPGRRVEVVDTVGAGDAFTSGLLASLAASGHLDRDALRAAGDEVLGDALAHAVRVAALTCTREGADPPTAAEVAAFD